jgi:hypothetical protein
MKSHQNTPKGLGGVARQYLIKKKLLKARRHNFFHSN